MSTLAGSESLLVVVAPKSVGYVDGEGAQARFSDPRGIATDAQGATYVADYGNSALRKVTKAGVVTTATRWSWEAALTEVAVDSLGSPYTLGPSAVVQKISAAGVASDLPLPSSQLYPGYGDPRALHLTTDRAGNLYIAYRLGHPLQDCGSWGPHIPCPTEYKFTYQKLSASGQWSTVATSDTIDALVPSEKPYLGGTGFAADGSGNLYLSGDNTILRIASSGAVSVLAGSSGAAGAAGAVDGQGPAARFLRPKYIALDAAGNVYVADSGNNTIRKITPAGMVTSVAGTPGKDELALGSLPGRLPSITGMAVDSDGNLVVSIPNGLVKVLLP